MPDRPEALALRDSLDQWLEGVAQGLDNFKAVRPNHRIPFHWPLPSVAKDFRVPGPAWTGRDEFEIEGEKFCLETAETAQGFFGRIPSLWVEARGDTEAEMRAALATRLEPLFARQHSIAACLGQTGRFRGHIRDLDSLDLLKLLFCPDRDVAHEASSEIETHASNLLFTPGLVRILDERKHPHRRSSQWAVLDLFEDLNSFCPDAKSKEQAVQAMKRLIWDAEDDFARTTFKAGVVLGGHLQADLGGQILLECLGAPSPYGRLSAIHGLYHVVEWEPAMKGAVVGALSAHAATESVPELKQFALDMARDIEAGEEHVDEPRLPD